MIYLIFFTITYFLISFSEKNKKLSFILEIIAISLMSLIAGLRDSSIGTDVNLYVKPVFEMSTKLNIFELNNIWYHVEYGYKLFNGIIALFTSNFSIYLFIQQFFIMFFSYYGIKHMFPKKYPSAYLIFMLLYYNRTLNIVRQFMALSLCIYSMKYIFEDNKKKFLITIFIAFFFHKSAIVFLIVYIIYHMYKKRERSLNKLILCICFSGFLIYFAFSPIVTFLSRIGLISSKYIYYTVNYVNEILVFNSIEIILDAFLIFIYLLFRKIYYKKSNISKFYFILLLIDFVCLIISGKYIAAYRLGMYFKIPAVLYFLTNFEIIFTNQKSCDIIAKLIKLSIAVLFWYCMYVIGNDGNTIPYKKAYIKNNNVNVLFIQKNGGNELKYEKTY